MISFFKYISEIIKNLFSKIDFYFLNFLKNIVRESVQINPEKLK